MALAPVLLFTYKRLDVTRQTVEALRNNFLASDSELFIFSDGPKNSLDADDVQVVRQYIHSVSGFKSVTIYTSDTNQGLASSIISGVSQIVNTFGQVIVLEDDLITSSNFLEFANQALQYYKNNKRIFSIGGYTKPIRGLRPGDVYVTRRGTSWGWATWMDRWNAVDWEVKDYAVFRSNRNARRGFNEMGSDMAGLLDKQMAYKVNSWAIRWNYHQFRKNLLTVFPSVSKVNNIGFGDSASHTKGRYNNFSTILDDGKQTKFNFSEDPHIDPIVLRQFLKPFTISQRIKRKILNAFSRL